MAITLVAYKFLCAHETVGWLFLLNNYYYTEDRIGCGPTADILFNSNIKRGFFSSFYLRLKVEWLSPTGRQRQRHDMTEGVA